MNSKILLVLSAIFALVRSVHAQGTAITYQGLLNENGGPAQGSNDFQFTLHSTASGTNPVSGTVTVNDLGLSNGLFTVTLDFGANMFNGSPRWLEIGVRPGNSADAYTSLSPRQPVNPTPYAIYAGGVNATNILGPITSNNLSSTLGLWSRSGTAIHYTAGNVGVGTNNPNSLLHVNGLATASQFSAAISSAAVVGYGFQSDPNTGVFSPANNELALATQGIERMRVNLTGSVGIGTSNPGYQLTVADANHQIAVVDTDNTNKTWTLTTIQNNGFGIYENGLTARLVVESGGKVTVDSGKAVVYNSGAAEVMIHKVVGTITLGGLSANSGVDGTLNWGNLGFTSPPAVFAGDFQPGPNGLESFAQILVTPHSATTTGCSIRIFNSGNTPATITSGRYSCVVIGNR